MGFSEQTLDVEVDDSGLRKKASNENGGRVGTHHPLFTRETRVGARQTSFPKKIQPCLTRSSNPNPFGYKPRVIATILAERQELWLQQDGATCHTARAIINLLKDTFGDRLISRFGPVNWPPRSCDLTPLDYFLWSYVKSLVYADKPQTLDYWEDNIRRVIAYTATNVGKKSSKIGRQIGLHPSQPWHHTPKSYLKM
ncbi:DUF4817 domain-containing protein [Trichonephila clavipes]|nr:DUF4817 domain-containing protein [Trichonephila clavipes]